ncbi:MAG: ATP-binding cassette domain-containing protein [Proteobacteria bacterium]|nr:ATP-binding cassette domain-containing protein [Pseudomonadota bacterium]
MGEVLSVSGLKKIYEVKKSAFSYKKEVVNAVNGVSFTLERGQTLGIVGESGSGKSTLARCILLLEKPDYGNIVFSGVNLAEITHKQLKKLRKDMQIIFQDPYSSLNPRIKVYDAIAEPVLFHKIAENNQAEDLVTEILKSVGISEDFFHKYPHEMSGGQRQRVAIGRALAVNPALIVADEPVSSLDVSIQAQIINLFMDIKESTKISMLFVSHDLNVVRFISDEIIVMYKGRVVEAGKTDEVFYQPVHPYTQMLIDSIKGGFLNRAGDDAQATGGCAYYPRCDKRQSICSGEMPELRGDTEHMVACLF